MNHSDICRILADLACEEHIKQNNNVIEKQPKDCSNYGIEYVNCIDVTANRIEEEKGIEETNKNI